MIHYPAVTVHGLAQAVAALAQGRPVALLSGRGAALYAGCAWWRELIGAARAVHPDVPAIDILDCADAPGRAMEALRTGQRLLVLDPACPAFAAVTGAAACLGATLLAARPPALDLAQRGAERRLAAWLAATPGAS
ncbi:MAG: hypothetical protein JO209_09705 [Acidisphaera sp.]|nr:hypothetical protein [Acidisphaera sp.]